MWTHHLELYVGLLNSVNVRVPQRALVGDVVESRWFSKGLAQRKKSNSRKLVRRQAKVHGPSTKLYIQ